MPAPVSESQVIQWQCHKKGDFLRFWAAVILA